MGGLGVGQACGVEEGLGFGVEGEEMAAEHGGAGLDGVKLKGEESGAVGVGGWGEGVELGQELGGLAIDLVEGWIGAVDGGFELLRSGGVVEGVRVAFAESEGELEVGLADGVEGCGWGGVGFAGGEGEAECGKKEEGQAGSLSFAGGYGQKGRYGDSGFARMTTPRFAARLIQLENHLRIPEVAEGRRWSEAVAVIRSGARSWG